MTNNNSPIEKQKTRGLTKKLKIHLFIFDFANILMWAAWYFTDRKEGNYGIPWPLFITIIWLLILLIHLFVNFKSNKTE
jgi:hypothetical protein